MRFSYLCTNWSSVRNYFNTLTIQHNKIAAKAYQCSNKIFQWKSSLTDPFRNLTSLPSLIFLENVRTQIIVWNNDNGDDVK